MKNSAHRVKADSASSILVILMGSLGDVARGLCLVSAVKRILPLSRITWLVEPKCRELVELHPDIDRIIVFDRPRGPLGMIKLYKRLIRENFDVTLDLQRHAKSGLFSLLSGARRRIGFNPRDAKELNWIFNNEYIPYCGDDISKWRHYLRFLDPLGIAIPDAPNFGLSGRSFAPDLPSTVASLPGPFVAMVMGSAWESKNWISEGYFRLIDDILASKKLQVVLVGDESQKGPAKRLRKQFDDGVLIDLVGRTSLRELLGVMQAASAAVGPDSGPGHLAAAVGTPHVTLFGPTSPQRTAPCGNEHLVIQADVACSPCYKRRCPEFDRRCMREIRVNTVKERLSEAILGAGRRDLFC